MHISKRQASNKYKVEDKKIYEIYKFNKPDTISELNNIQKTSLYFNISNLVNSSCLSEAFIVCALTKRN